MGRGEIIRIPFALPVLSVVEESVVEDRHGNALNPEDPKEITGACTIQSSQLPCRVYACQNHVELTRALRSLP